jgi:hypothetical protein
MLRSVLIRVPLGILLFTTACSSQKSVASEPLAGEDPSVDAGADPSVDAGADRAQQMPPDAGSAAEAEVAPCGSPLRVYDESPGVLEEIFVDLPVAGKVAPFIVDMGSAMSFLSMPALADGGMGFTADAGATTISCVATPLPGLSGVALTSTPDGLPIGGGLGVDLVTRGAALDLRITDSLFTWWRTPPTPPAGATVVPLKLHTSNDAYGNNVLVASGIQLDGKDVRLMLDTGSPHVLILSATPRPNETVVQTEDGNGEPVTLYTSTISIAFGGGTPRTVAVDRAASFPTLEKTFAALNDGVTGILGLDALGHDRIVIAKDSLAFMP